MKWAGIFFGLNYKHLSGGHLNGCIKDTILMKNLLTSLLGEGDINLYNDEDNPEETSYDGIIQTIFDMSIRAIKQRIELVVIHYSGHGSSVTDSSSDESDGRDEVICPSDYPTRGMLKDDIIAYLLAGFPSYTKVVTIFDSCHSGTVTDLPFKWSGKNIIRENSNRMPSKIISISGCRDAETSSDTLTGGALTTNIVKLLSQDKSLSNNVFELINKLNFALARGGFEQRSVLCSSHDLRNDCQLFCHQLKS